MSRKRDYLPEFEAPKKKLCSERDSEIKNLLHRQMNVSISLQRELQKEKVFDLSAETLTLSSFDPGTKTYQELQDKEQRQLQIENLVKAGFVKDDIKLYFEYVDKGINFVKDKYHNHEPELLNSKLKDIIEKVSEHNSQISTANNDGTSSSKRNTDSLLVLPHPMDDIKELESNFMYSLNSASSHLFDPLNVAKIRRKARKEQTRLEKVTSISSSTISQVCTSDLGEKPNNSFSLWDKTEPPAQIPLKTMMKKEYSCQKQNLYTIRKGEIVQLSDDVKLKTDIKIAGQLSFEEIVKIPSFGNYTPGEPTNVLFVKNLPKKITEPELSIIFKNRPAMEYKIMQGKMRGQAFLTYECIETASEALNLSNGVIVNDKPIIVQFGRKRLN